MNFQFNDGGRIAAGFKGTTGDCVVRAIAIATGLPYLEVYNKINHLGSKEHITTNKKGKSDARTGVYTQAIHKFMNSIGWSWTPTMFIGSGCKVHLDSNELPKGVLICKLSRHCATVIDGTLNDIYDCSRDGTRCVYGYWRKQ